MKKLILITIAAFAIGLGATTMLVVKRHPSAPAPVAKPEGLSEVSVGKPPAHDSTSEHVTDSTAHDSSHASTDTTASHETAAAPTTATPAPAPVAGPPVVSHAIDASTVAPEKTKAFKEVARIFSSMKAAEAAKVLAFLSDTEVEGILRAVGPRQAADFMTNLPKERAAALSRRLLVPQPPKAEGAGQ